MTNTRLRHDPDTRGIYEPVRVLCAYRRETNLRDSLVRSHPNTITASDEDRDTFLCGRSRCNTCTHTNALPRINTPEGYIAINSKYSCTRTHNVVYVIKVYVIKCRTCNKIYIEETGRRFREHLRSTRQTNTDLPVHCYFSSPRHACTDRLASEIPKIGAASKPGSSSNTKRYIQEDLLTTLPSYKHPKSMRASHIEIVFDLNAYTRADLSLRAQNTSNSNFYRCHAHNSKLLFTADEEAAASRSGVFYVSSAQKKYTY